LWDPWVIKDEWLEAIAMEFAIYDTFTFGAISLDRLQNIHKESK
jgi:hypothetical protein